MFDSILNFINDIFFNFDLVFSLQNVIQVIIIIVMVLFLYHKFIRDTQVEKLVRGIIIFIFATWFLSFLLIKLDFQILGMLAQALLTIIIFSLVIVFQPELRRLLVQLGQANIWSNSLWHKQNKNELRINILEELVKAVKYCSKVKRGALIVLQKSKDLSGYDNQGTLINSDITAELLLTIFFPSTPLHDGAVVIHRDKILAAGVLLPLTKDPKLSWRYGTRHRAAIGQSEKGSDYACLVVSEETGDVSIAVDGNLTSYDDITKFRKDLESILNFEKEKNAFESTLMFNLIKLRKK